MQILEQTTARDFDPRVDVHNAVLGACAQARQWKAALLVLDSMLWNDLAPTAVSYDQAIRAVGRSGPPGNSRVTDLFQEMWWSFAEAWRTGPAPTADLYRTAMRVCGWIGEWERGVQALDDMRKYALLPDTATYAVAMEICQWETALVLLDDLRSQHLDADVQTYRAAVETCGTGGQPEIVLSLLAETRQLGLPPDAVIYGAAISACEQTHRWEWMPQLLSETVHTLLAESSHLQDVAGLDLKAFRAAISACARCREWELALRLLGELAHRGADPDVDAFNAAVCACTRCGHGPQVLPLLAEMQQWRLQPDLMTYHAAMHEHVITGDWRSARDLYTEACRGGISDRWIRAQSTINVTALPPEVAAIAVRILLEETRRKPTAPTRRFEIITGGGERGEGGSPDEEGFDSPLKRFLHQVLTEEFRLKVDPFFPAAILIPRLEVKRLRAEFQGLDCGSAGAPKRQRRSAVDRALEYVWQQSSNE